MITTCIIFAEFPPDELNSQDESALEDTMESELTEEDMSPKKSKKRKAGGAGDKKSKVSAAHTFVQVIGGVWNCLILE
jgi:hypothetical protein